MALHLRDLRISHNAIAQHGKNRIHNAYGQARAGLMVKQPGETKHCKVLSSMIDER